MCLGVLPISHNFGLIGVCHLSIYRGDGVVILPNFDLQEMLRVTQEFKLNRLWMVRLHHEIFTLYADRLINTTGSCNDRSNCEGTGNFKML